MLSKFVLEYILVFADILHAFFSYVDRVIYECQHNCTF